MSIHIGKIIHELIKKRGIKAKAVAKAINVSEASVYKIYKRASIDIDKLILLSQFLDENLFIYYFRKEPLKSMLSNEMEKLRNELTSVKSLLSQKEKRVKELEDINASQQKVISLLEKGVSKNKK